MPVVGQDWDDLSDIQHRARLLKAGNKLATVKSSAIIEAEAEEKEKPSGDTVVYKDYMKPWPKPEFY